MLAKLFFSDVTGTYIKLSYLWTIPDARKKLKASKVKFL